MAALSYPDAVLLREGDRWRVLGRCSFRDAVGAGLEADLQQLIETHPEIVPTIDMAREQDANPRLCVLAREVFAEGGSVDLLLVDQSGVLTVVETKLIENSDAHRAVIGQVLEYASAALASWNATNLRERAESYWKSRQGTLEDALVQSSIRTRRLTPSGSRLTRCFGEGGSES